MERISVSLPAAQVREIKAEARRRGVSLSQVVRERVQLGLSDEQYAAIAELARLIEAEDVMTNKMRGLLRLFRLPGSILLSTLALFVVPLAPSAAGSQCHCVYWPGRQPRVSLARRTHGGNYPGNRRG